MLKKIRESKITKVLSVFTVFNLFLMIFNPSVAFALGGGPSQPEVQSFEPVGTTEMVNLFSGDFTYNIPLMDVGGYPINISYHSGITTDQEASWVGLGWNINPGVINRGMRGLPDDFNGDKIHKDFYMKPNQTYGLSLGGDIELFGLKIPKFLKKAKFSFGLNYNNYVGVGMEFGLSQKFSKGAKDSKTEGLGATASLSLSAGTNGVGISPGLSFSKKIENAEQNELETKSSISVGLGFNSRAGLTAINMGVSMSTKGNLNRRAKDKKGNKVVVSKKYIDTGTNGGASISFATSSYTPQLNMPMLNESFNFRITLGSAILGSHPDINVSGYYATQYLAYTSRYENSYGYLYYQNASNNAVFDINREKDGGFMEFTPALPVINYTYDTYSVSGQGIGGTYRPYRGSIGIVHDRENWNYSANISYPSIEIGGGNAFHDGINFNMSNTNSRSGYWTSGNNLSDNFNFAGNFADNDFETVYFKQAGEKTYDPDVDETSGLFNSVGGFKAVRVGIDKAGSTHDELLDKNNNVVTISGTYKRNKRDKRNEVISYLTAKEAEIFGVTKELEVYDFSSPSNLSTTVSSIIPRVSSLRKPYHISQINVTRSDGVRYIYGIPAYNKSQEEATFAISAPYDSFPDAKNEISETINGVVNYIQGRDDKKKNNNGRDEFFSKTTIPGYAHSYLLTHIFSPDYVDSDGIPGPSKGDIGTYTKFNYSRVNDYQWKIPYNSGEANYSEGLRSDSLDDKASYVKGNKELWYLHSIESKDYIAFFITSKRNLDALPTSGSNRMRELDEIRLYYKKNGLTNYSSETPIKTVHFRYNNKLCPGIDNGTGKLTLKEIWFTYGKSRKGELNKYKFNYGKDNNINNPSYGIKNYDRWGNYKPNNLNKPNSVFPYTSQEQGKADSSAQAWNLKEITLPSGGKINVEYEADDYAFVQDRRAMQMFEVVGVENKKGANSFSPSKLYSGNLSSGFVDRNIIVVKYPSYYRDYFDIDNSGSFSQSEKDAIISAFIRDRNSSIMKNLYFKFFINVGNNLKKAYEYVSGWAEIDKDSINEVKLDYNNSTISIPLKRIKINEGIPIGKISPILQTAVNFTCNYLPRIAYNQPDPSSNVLVQVIKALVSTVTGIIQFVGGTTKVMITENKSKEFVASKSFLRLFNPIGKKKGGGERVKSIRISDEWNSMSGETTSVYGQKYDYTLDDGKTSSGVASYEPAVGGEENPFRQPLTYSDKKKLVPKHEYILDLPLGESFFPAPSVGYSKVTVTNYVENPNPSEVLGRTGKVVHRFYTAKDFPTRVERTTLQPGNSLQRKKSHVPFSPVSWDKMTASEGFLVELNDMHGKQKSVEYFGEDGTIKSATKYFYKTNGNQVDNKAKIIYPDGSTDDKLIGVDYDFMVDMRESRTKSHNVDVQLNIDAFLAAFFPAVIPVLLSLYHSDEVRFRSVVTTKVINRYALLKRTESYQDGSVISTENMAYDAETGEVLLTKISNEYNRIDINNVQPNDFHDVYYTFKYPAHWAYDGMGQAYKNISVMDNISIDNNGIVSGINYLVNGDELMMIKDGQFVHYSNPNSDSGRNYYKYWCQYNAKTKRFSIIDRFGYKLVAGNYTAKVLRSGRKNMQNITIGNITCRKYPINGDGHLEFNQGKEIIAANAVLLTDRTNLACNCQNIEAGTTFNPFVKGAENNWRKFRDYVYLTQRRYCQTLRDSGYNTNIRDDGIYSSFTPFWNWNSRKHLVSSFPVWNILYKISNWTWTNEVTKYSSYGMELENKNPLGIYSSAVYGYNFVKPIAVANNARLTDIAFDGFEDYKLDNCPNDHFSFELPLDELNDSTVEITTETSHSGRRSIKLGPGKTISLSKNTLNN